MNQDSRNDGSKGKIVIVKGSSQYNVLRLASDLIAKGFQENGYETAIIDGTKLRYNTDLADAIKREMKDNGKFIFSYNGMGHDILLTTQKSVYDYLGYPVFGFMVDHPIYHQPRLKLTQGENIHLGYIDKEHVKYVKDYYPNLQNVSFIPHFSFQAENFIPYDQREIEVYFPGSYQNPEKELLNIQSNLPKVFSDLAMELISDLFRDKKLTLEEAIRSYFDRLNFQYTTEEFMELIEQLFPVDRYVRNYHRCQMIKIILDAGIKLTVCGSGWDQLKEEYPDNLVILGTEGLDIEDNINLIANTKILINILPNFKNGTHERIFTAMMNGCVCVTDDNEYLAEQFADGENIVFYDLEKLEKLTDKVMNLLDHPEEAKRIAENGYRKAQLEYDDKSTACRVLEIMGLE